jgi:aromatic-L-amino-acid decarboxylase
MIDDITTAKELSEEHRVLGEKVTRLIADYVGSLTDRAVTSRVGVRELVEMFDEPLPETGISADEIIDEFEREILPNGMQIPSPRYFGLFNPTPLPISVWADALASAINQNGAVWRNSSAANVIEARVLRWLCELLGYGDSGFGTLTSGGSEANLIALKCARDRVHKEIRDKGLRAASGDLIFYASEQCHYSLVKSVDILGLGRDSLRKIPTDDHFHMRTEILHEEIKRDLDAGKLICGIAGAAGATSTGIIDPLDRLADIAQLYGCWFHVDAAYGGAIAASEKHRSKLKGIERADSITIDPHKWMFVPFACGAVLVRDGAGVLRQGFDITPEYLSENRGGSDVEFDLFRYGQLGTRRFNALKIWMALKLLGRNGYERIVDRQIELTNYFASRIDELPDFERIGEVETAVCCFRFLPLERKGTRDAERDALQQLLQQRIERSGEVWFATTVLHGRRAMRVNINSFLTDRPHIDQLIDVLQRESRALIEEGNAK